MSTLTFDLSYNDLVDCFGADRVERSVREDAEALGFAAPPSTSSAPPASPPHSRQR